MPRLLRIAPAPILAFAALSLAPLAAQTYGPWHVLGRFEHPFDEGSTTAPFAPEKPKLLELLAHGGPGPDLAAAVERPNGAPIRWRCIGGDFDRDQLDCGVIDLHAACKPVDEAGRADDVVAYLYRRIETAEALELPVTIGTDDGVRAWLDGRPILERHVLRALVAQDDAVTFRLEPGVHHLLVKVSQKGGPWSFRISPRQRIAQKAINDAIDRGAEFLIQHQLLDGSWGVWNEWGGGHAAYGAYTLLKCGIDRHHPAVRMALRYAEERPVDTTYALSTLILALEATGDASHRERMQSALDELVSVQTGIGLFDYPIHPNGDSPPEDLSNSLYAALALRAARHAGLEVPDETWTKLAAGALRCLEEPKAAAFPDGSTREIAGFSYRPQGHATGSTTTAGLSVLAICEEQAGARMLGPLRARVAEAKALSIAWIEHELIWSCNPGHGKSHVSFWIYGLERVGALLSLERFGDAEWYWLGAEHLVDSQAGNGSWNPEGYARHEYLDTLLSLLFLKRATLRTSGESSKAGVAETSDARADVRLRATGDTPLTVWVADLSDKIVGKLGGEHGALDIERIEYFARRSGDGGEPQAIGTVQASQARRDQLQRFALRHAFEHSGKWLVKARVVARPPGAEGSPQTFESPELEVHIDGVLAAARLDYAADLDKNLLFGAKAKPTSSSRSSDGRAASRAFDGDFGTWWLCAKDDGRPWARITLDRGVKADRMLVSHAAPRLASAAEPRIADFEVVVNQKQRFKATMSIDVLAKTVVAFGEPILVRDLEIRVLSSSGGELGEISVGFSEIELQKGR